MTAKLRAYILHNHLALLALALAVIGVPTAWAIARNSVGSAQIKRNAVKNSDIADNAVKSPEVADGSLLSQDFGAGQLPAGAQGPEGPIGPQGPPGPFPDVLPSGKTLRGTYAVRWTAASPAESQMASISFGFTFASAPIPHVNLMGGVPAPQCPGNAGNPQALPGHLCIYESSQTNRSTPLVFNVNFVNTADPFGANVLVQNVGAGQAASSGSWAATSP